MTREEYKKEIFNEYSSTKVYKSAKKYIKSLEKQLKAKDEEIKGLGCRVYHAEGYINDLHNNPKDKKFYDKKARSIVAMLFWEWKKQCKNCEQYNNHAFAREQKRSEAYYCFQKAYAMLKATT